MFSSLNDNSGDIQKEIEKSKRDKAEFTSRHGLYRSTRMLLGFKDKRATFQRALDVTLLSVRWQFALYYLEDIFLFSKTSRHHYKQARWILRLLSKSGLTTTLEGCKFLAEMVKCLGIIIRPARSILSQHTTDANIKDKNPISTSDLWSLSRFCNFFRRFLPNFASLLGLNNKKYEKEPTQNCRPRWWKMRDCVI